METYATIFHRAAERHGGEDILIEKINAHHPAHNGVGAVMSDDRWLSQFTKRVFQSGFNWKVVEHKWAGFESAFWKFNPYKCVDIDMEDMERLTSDKSIVRHGAKIKSVAQNADMILQMTERKGSADAFIRSWPADDYIGLLDYLNKHGSRLGPATASYALRFSGVPSFILSSDVTAALKHAGIVDGAVTSKSAKRAVQAAFNIWMEESGSDLTTISRTLAMSIDAGGN